MSEAHTSDGEPRRNSEDMSLAVAPLRAFLERIERLDTEKQAIADDIKEVYAEAKGTGYDTKQMRVIVRMRKQDQAKRAEERAILELYLDALGMI